MSAFFKWVATLPPLAQVLIVLVAFAIVVGILIFLLEVAPRSGRRYTIIRLAACILIPLLVLLRRSARCGGPRCVAAVPRRCSSSGSTTARVQGAGYLFQLVGLPGARDRAAGHRPGLPGHPTIVQSFMNSRGNRFVGLDNFIWIFTQQTGIRTVLNTIVWVLIAPIVSTAFGLAYAVFIDKSRGEKFFKVLVFMPMAISFVGASIIWRFIYTARPADQPQIGLLNQIVVWFGGQPVDVPRGTAVEHLLPDRRADLGADRFRHGRALRGHQGRSDRADRGGRSTAPTRGSASATSRCPASARRSSSC